MTNPDNQTDQQLHTESVEGRPIDFKRYLSLYISNWYWFVIALFIALSIAYAINRWSEKVFTVSSTMLIKDDKLSGSAGELGNIFPGSEAFVNQQNLNNEIGILKSFKLNLRVIEELKSFHIVYYAIGKRNIVETKQYASHPFIVEYDSLENQILGKPIKIRLLSSEKYLLEIDGDPSYKRELQFGDRFSEGGFDFTIKLRNGDQYGFNPDKSNKYYFYFVDPSSLANLYKNKLSVNPIGQESTLVTLTTSGPVPEQEIDYLNKLMDIYIKQGLEMKNEIAEKTIQFIDEQLGSISDSLSIAEGKLESFRTGNRIIDLSKEGISIQNKLEQIDEEKTQLMLKKRYFDYLKDYITSKNESGDIIAPTVMGISDQLLIKAVDELSQLQKQKIKLGMNFDESSEPFKLIETSIANAKQIMIENINSSLQNTEQSLKENEARHREVEKSMNKLPATERRLLNIQRKFDINNTVYTYLLEKKAEAGIVRASNVSDNRIIDYASPYSTSMIKPKSKNNNMIALVMGLLIPIILISLIDLLNNKVIDKEDILAKTSTPIIGFISHNSLDTELPVVKNPSSTLAESLRSIRTNLKYFLKDTHCPVISISSTISAEGKTFVSANLAAILAMSGKKVLLIGLDLRKPRIHKILDIKNEVGISNFLISEQKFEDVVEKTNIDNLWYAPSGPVPPNPAELIESAAMGEFIEKAKANFDYVLIDTPPVAIVTDAILVSQFTDFYIFVVRQRYTSKNTLEVIDELYRNENIKRIGLVINDISMSGYYGYGLRYGYALGYGYNYGYNYYYQYGKYGYNDKSKGYYKDDEGASV
jgi:capsular exopolysaccharide synthesis family protein